MEEKQKTVLPLSGYDIYDDLDQVILNQSLDYLSSSNYPESSYPATRDKVDEKLHYMDIEEMDEMQIQPQEPFPITIPQEKIKEVLDKYSFEHWDPCRQTVSTLSSLGEVCKFIKTNNINQVDTLGMVDVLKILKSIPSIRSVKDTKLMDWCIKLLEGLEPPFTPDTSNDLSSVLSWTYKKCLELEMKSLGTEEGNHYRKELERSIYANILLSHCLGIKDPLCQVI